MAATAVVQECNGAAAGVWTTVTAAKFCTKDMYNPGTTYPIPIPDSGTKYSYWKSHQLHFTGTYTEITNIKIYTDGGGFGTGITVYIAKKDSDYGVPQANYDQASGAEGDSGDEVQVTHSHTFTGKDDLFGFIEASPCSVDAGPYSSPPDDSDHIVLQMDVINTASPGELTPETITWVYDEV